MVDLKQVFLSRYNLQHVHGEFSRACRERNLKYKESPEKLLRNMTRYAERRKVGKLKNSDPMSRDKQSYLAYDWDNALFALNQDYIKARLPWTYSRSESNPYYTKMYMSDGSTKAPVEMTAADLNGNVDLWEREEVLTHPDNYRYCNDIPTWQNLNTRNYSGLRERDPTALGFQTLDPDRASLENPIFPYNDEGLFAPAYPSVGGGVPCRRSNPQERVFKSWGRIRVDDAPLDTMTGIPPRPALPFLDRDLPPPRVDDNHFWVEDLYSLWADGL